MTDTTILDGMMKMLARNPMTRERMGHLSANEVAEGEAFGADRQRVQTDVRPFYAKREVVKKADANPHFAEIVDLFHQDLSATRTERPRRGTCPRVRREFDGSRWVRPS
jgi:hypothetical protein